MLELVKRLIEQAETKETFFKRIASFLAPMDPRYVGIERAYDYAEVSFLNTKRDDDEPYFTHLRSTSLIVVDYLRVRDPAVIIAALSHDIVEDIPSWTIERVRIEFGDEVALLLDYLSKPPLNNVLTNEQSEKIYHDRFQNAPRKFFYIKLADRLHNLLTMWSPDPERKAHKIEETRRYYLPYAERENILLHELEAAIYELEQKQA